MKKMIKNLAVIAVTAGFIALTSCRTEQLTPEQDGRNLAVELCNCFLQAGDNITAMSACLADFRANADRWTGADREALQAAFDIAIQDCQISPLEQYYTRIALIAAPEFCEFFTNNPEADMMSMMGSEVARFYPYFYNPLFVSVLIQQLMTTCPTTPMWFICLMTGGQAPGCE